MRGLKRDLWKAGIAIAGLLLLLVFMAWVQVEAAGAYARASGLATSVTVQATPTANSTIAAETANEQLRKLQRDNDRSLNAWFWNNAATILSAVLSTLVIVSGALIAFWRWRGDQRTEREKRAEERFQAAVTGLGDEKEGARIGAAILLRTFLRPGYEQFYTQTFDLAVANLRLPRTPTPPEDPDGIPRSPKDPNTPLPLTTLSQALIVVFKEAFPLARSQDQGRPQPLDTPGIQFLDATGIQLDNAYLSEADLKDVWMPMASLRGAFLGEANLSGAVLISTHLSGAFLGKASLSGAILISTHLSRAELIRADFSKADLSKANLSGANLSGANIEDAQSLKDANLHGVIGLTKKQLEACKAKGAIIDEDTAVSPSQPTAAPSPPSQSNDAQAPSAPPAQGSTPTPETDDSSAPSSKPGPES